MKFEIKHRITGAVQFSLETESLKLCLQAAIKSGADLRDADLSGADLRGADLRGADLRGAHLRGANLVASLGQPNGWDAYTYFTKGEHRIQVGCKNFTLLEGRKYWTGKADRQEVLAALDYAEAIAKIRGWQK